MKTKIKFLLLNTIFCVLVSGCMSNNTEENLLIINELNKPTKKRIDVNSLFGNRKIEYGGFKLKELIEHLTTYKYHIDNLKTNPLLSVEYKASGITTNEANKIILDSLKRKYHFVLREK